MWHAGAVRFHPLMRTTEQCLVEAAPDTVRERMREAVAEGRLRGSVRDTGFSVTVPLTGGRNSWQAVLSGKLVEAPNGTLVELSLMPHLFVVIFTLFHAIPFLGLSWLMGVAAFSGDVNRSLQGFGEAIRASAIGRDAVIAMQPLSDPTRPGAEAGAPLTLSPRLQDEGVTFASGGWTLWVGPSRVRATDPDGIDLDLEWEELEGADTRGDELVLRTKNGVVILPLRNVPEHHQLWLATYVDAVAHRFRASTEDAARQDEARRQLGRLREG